MDDLSIEILNEMNYYLDEISFGDIGLSFKRYGTQVGSAIFQKIKDKIEYYGWDDLSKESHNVSKKLAANLNKYGKLYIVYDIKSQEKADLRKDYKKEITKNGRTKASDDLLKKINKKNLELANLDPKYKPASLQKQQLEARLKQIEVIAEKRGKRGGKKKK